MVSVSWASTRRRAAGSLLSSRPRRGVSGTPEPSETPTAWPHVGGKRIAEDHLRQLGAGFVAAVARGVELGQIEVWQRIVLHVVSSRGESHPSALAEPGVNLSAHPAPIVQPSGSTPSFQ